jgi:hypothetical protein
MYKPVAKRFSLTCYYLLIARNIKELTYFAELLPAQFVEKLRFATKPELEVLGKAQTRPGRVAKI